MFISSNIGIIADDLTGANDTALQFHNRGCNTQLILDLDADVLNQDLVQCWAVSTESRNIPSYEAFESVERATKYLKEKLNIEHFYKKIDSTLRGHIAREALVMLDILQWDAAIILPAFPSEGRVTVGGYHLLKGIPIERTELALDPHSPIYESHIPTILKRQLTEEEQSLVGHIELETVMKGAAPILLKLNELINNGKKLIVVDAVSTTDIEQAILATEKSSFDILPCGSAALAQGLANVWLNGGVYQASIKNIPQLPKLVISGSATKLTASQISRLEDDDDFLNTYFVPLKIEDIMNGVSDELVDRICKNLGTSNIVAVHSSNIAINPDADEHALLLQGITKERFLTMITSYLAELTRRVLEKAEVILVILGGETSCKCCNSLNSRVLQIIDEVAPAMPLCRDYNAQWIVTKSGNLGNSMTLVEILRYFESHK